MHLLKLGACTVKLGPAEVRVDEEPRRNWMGEYVVAESFTTERVDVSRVDEEWSRERPAGSDPFRPGRSITFETPNNENPLGAP